MTTIQIKDSDGSVVIFGNPACQPTPKAGYTIRQVDALPAGPGNVLWQDGALVRIPPPASPVPTLTARQLRLWLLSMQITTEMIDAQIDAMTDAEAKSRARVEWEYATEYKHDHPLVLQIGAALGMTPAQINDGFRAASSL